MAIIAGELGRQEFGDAYQQEIRVLPPEEGTFLTRLGIAVGVGWGFISTEPGDNFIRGLTGRAASDWTEAAGELIRDLMVDALLAVINGEFTTTPQLGEDVACGLAVIEASRQFMLQDEGQLAAKGVDKD